MRVVAGAAKGRRLIAPRGRGTRPTADGVREAIFNTLSSVVELEDARVADLYAGSGALGIEALSRGAAHCVFVENDPRALAAIDRNLREVGFDGASDVVRSDVLRWLQRAAGAFDVVFADPPYAFDRWAYVGARLQADVLVVESDRRVALDGDWEILKVKQYGSTVVTLFVPRSSV